jgi:S-phase kinase-associated protein 1
MSTEKIVHIVSQEGESFDVALDVAIQSELVKTMIDEEQDEAEVQEIPLPNVKSAVLAKSKTNPFHCSCDRTFHLH